MNIYIYIYKMNIYIIDNEYIYIYIYIFIINRLLGNVCDKEKNAPIAYIPQGICIYDTIQVYCPIKHRIIVFCMLSVRYKDDKILGKHG